MVGSGRKGWWGRRWDEEVVRGEREGEDQKEERQEGEDQRSRCDVLL